MPTKTYKLTAEQRGWLLRWRSHRDYTGRKVFAGWSWTADGHVEIRLTDGGTITSKSTGEVTAT
jgi:hypothetical protein